MLKIDPPTPKIEFENCLFFAIFWFEATLSVLFMKGVHFFIKQGTSTYFLANWNHLNLA